MKGVTNFLIFLAVATGLVLCVVGIGLVPLWLGLMLMGADGRAAKAKGSLQTVLMNGEDLIAHGVQHRVFAFFHRRTVVAITSSRVLTLQRGLFGGFKMKDIQWKDLLDVKLEQNVMGGLCGSNLRFDHLNRSLSALAIDGVPMDTASAVYSRAQAEEQAWEEKRRIRVMEEVRAAAGGVVVNAPAAPPSSGGSRVLEEIGKAKALLDAGAISDVEFQEMKAKILAA